jgi:predicted phage baseplate assembly protein
MSASASLTCRGSQRRELLRRINGRPNTGAYWTGIEAVEFDCDRPNEILVYLLCPPAGSKSRDLATKWTRDDFELWDESCRRTVPLHQCVQLGSTCLRIFVRGELRCGATYRLTLPNRAPFDPQFSAYRFAATPEVVQLDPKKAPACPPRKAVDPHPNYLARDFTSLRQLILDRLAQTLPDWNERHVPDLGMTLVELMAFVGDYLSYYQDAVGVEAYLNTARQRVSVRRHARLVDYTLHEGCNARTFVHVEVGEDGPLDVANIAFMTRHPEPRFASQLALPISSLSNVPPRAVQVFEPAATPPRPPFLSVDDITDPQEFVARLSQIVTVAANLAMNPVATAIQSLMSELTQQMQESICCAAAVENSLAARELVSELVAVVNRWLAQWRAVGSPQNGVQTLCELIGATHQSPQERPQLYAAHNRIEFYAWSARECWLPIGATRATLRDDAPRDAVPSDVGSSSSESASASVGPSTLQLLGESSEQLIRLLTEARRLHLAAGDYLLLEEALGPRTHQPGDADPQRRQVVRLTSVRRTFDAVTSEPIVEIEWRPEDALRFPLCISSVGPRELGCPYNAAVSVARGNLLLVDHGKRIDEPEWLGATTYAPGAPACGADDLLPSDDDVSRSSWLRPTLARSDLTFAMPGSASSACSSLAAEPRDALPAIAIYGFPVADEPLDHSRPDDVPPPTLVTWTDLASPVDLLIRFPQLNADEQRRIEAILTPEAAALLQSGRTSVRAVQFQTNRQDLLAADRGEPRSSKSDPKLREEYECFKQALNRAVQWQARTHLLDSLPGDQHVVVEIDDFRWPHLRFGDDDLGRRPPDRTSFYAVYRTGEGTIGNIGAERLVHVLYRNERPANILSVRNPLAACGGTDPEHVDQARIRAPHHFRELQRAVLAEDYAALVMRQFRSRVQQAHATSHWTGSFRQINVVVDPVSGERHVAGLLTDVEAWLNGRRRIGHRVRVQLPRFVGLQVDLAVCVRDGYLSAHVRLALADQLGASELPDGSKGLFHPDRLSLGDSFYLSRLVAAAKAVEGVENVHVTRFDRIERPDGGALRTGVLRFGPLEVPRLDNDPNRPEYGILTIRTEGAR